MQMHAELPYLSYCFGILFVLLLQFGHPSEFGMHMSKRTRRLEATKLRLRLLKYKVSSKN